MPTHHSFNLETTVEEDKVMQNLPSSTVVSKCSVCPISGETEREEKLNHITHLFGLLLSIIGWIVMIVYTWNSGTLVCIASCSTYGATVVLLYAASTYYHGCQTLSKKQLLQIADHACIYLLIAGSYMPFTLGPLRDSGGITLLGIVWGMAIVGIIIKFFAVNRFKIISTCAYLLMGWLAILSFPTLLEKLPTISIFYLVAGGLAYSLGTIFFLWDRLPFNHAIWHLFVLAGSTLHYCSIFTLIQNGLI